MGARFARILDWAILLNCTLLMTRCIEGLVIESLKECGTFLNPDLGVEKVEVTKSRLISATAAR